MKGLKVAILVLAPIVLIAGLWFTFFNGPPEPGVSSIEFVNIMTGDLVTKPVSKISGYPELTDDPSPKPYLYPVERDTDKQLIIPQRFRGILKDQIKNKVVDAAAVRVDMDTFHVKSK